MSENIFKFFKQDFILYNQQKNNDLILYNFFKTVTVKSIIL